MSRRKLVNRVRGILVIRFVMLMMLDIGRVIVSKSISGVKKIERLMVISRS